MTCPRGHLLERVRDEYAQATRYEPRVLLGRFGYCRTCDVAVRVPADA